MPCPRCTGRLFSDGDIYCVNCGYRYYDKPKRIHRKILFPFVADKEKVERYRQAARLCWERRRQLVGK